MTAWAALPFKKTSPNYAITTRYLKIWVAMNWNEFPPQLIGTVSGSNWAACLVADRATNTPPAGSYTMLMLPHTNNAPPFSSPGGNGYASITHSGRADEIVGALADGTPFSELTPVSEDGEVPIYANLYTGKGLLLGWINIYLTNTVGTGLTWIRPARSTGLYKNGFTNVLLADQILISPWTNPPVTILAATNLSFLDTVSDTNTLMNFNLTISDKFILSEAAGPAGSRLFTGSINPKTGMLKVTAGSGTERRLGYGAVLLSGTNGGGYFLTETNAGALILEP